MADTSRTSKSSGKSPSPRNRSPPPASAKQQIRSVKVRQRSPTPHPSRGDVSQTSAAALPVTQHVPVAVSRSPPPPPPARPTQRVTLPGPTDPQPDKIHLSHDASVAFVPGSVPARAPGPTGFTPPAPSSVPSGQPAAPGASSSTPTPQPVPPPAGTGPPPVRSVFQPVPRLADTGLHVSSTLPPQFSYAPPVSLFPGVSMSAARQPAQTAVTSALSGTGSSYWAPPWSSPSPFWNPFMWPPFANTPTGSTVLPSGLQSPWSVSSPATCPPPPGFSHSPTLRSTPPTAQPPSTSGSVTSGEGAHSGRYVQETEESVTAGEGAHSRRYVQETDSCQRTTHRPTLPATRPSRTSRSVTAGVGAHSRRHVQVTDESGSSGEGAHSRRYAQQADGSVTAGEGAHSRRYVQEADRRAQGILSESGYDSHYVDDPPVSVTGHWDLDPLERAMATATDFPSMDEASLADPDDFEGDSLLADTDTEADAPPVLQRESYTPSLSALGEALSCYTDSIKVIEEPQTGLSYAEQALGRSAAQSSSTFVQESPIIERALHDARQRLLGPSTADSRFPGAASLTAGPPLDQSFGQLAPPPARAKDRGLRWLFPSFRPRCQPLLSTEAERDRLGVHRKLPSTTQISHKALLSFELTAAQGLTTMGMMDTMLAALANAVSELDQSQVSADEQDGNAITSLIEALADSTKHAADCLATLHLNSVLLRRDRLLTRSVLPRAARVAARSLPVQQPFLLGAAAGQVLNDAAAQASHTLALKASLAASAKSRRPGPHNAPPRKVPRAAAPPRPTAGFSPTGQKRPAMSTRPLPRQQGRRRAPPPKGKHPQ